MLHETIKKRARRQIQDGDSSSSSSQRGGKSSILTVAPLLKEMRKQFAQFRGNYQQDAHELFVSFLWAIDEELDPEPPHKDDPAAAGSSTPVVSSSDIRSTITNMSQDDVDTDVDVRGGEDPAEEPTTKQIFVKTPSGDTISLQVPAEATVTDVQKLLAKKLNLNEEDMMLQSDSMRTSSSSLRGSSSRSRQSMAASKRKYSRTNFTRSLFGGGLTTYVVATYANGMVVSHANTHAVLLCE